MTKIIKKILKVSRVSAVCSDLGVARTSVISAVERGEIPVTQTSDGYDLVDETDIKKWLANRPKRGRKKKAKK